MLDVLIAITDTHFQAITYTSRYVRETNQIGGAEHATVRGVGKHDRRGSYSNSPFPHPTRSRKDYLVSS